MGAEIPENAGQGRDAVSTQITDAFESEIQRDHGDRPLDAGDSARIWRHAGLQGIELFRGSYQNYRFARHFHRVPAIGVVERGAMSSYCRRATHVLGAGTVLLLNPGEIHAPAPAGKSGWSFRMFYLEEEFLRSTLLLCEISGFRFQQPFVQNRHLAAKLFQLHLALEEDGDRLQFESLLVSIFSCLTERHIETAAQPKKFAVNRTAIEMARQYIEANCHKDIRLTELAEISQYSASHFLRMFRDAIGLTPHAYLTQFRVERAISLLKAGMPIVDIAHSLGFTDQSHFTKKFKRILGVTPGQYTADLKFA